MGINPLRISLLLSQKVINMKYSFHENKILKKKSLHLFHHLHFPDHHQSHNSIYGCGKSSQLNK